MNTQKDLNELKNLYKRWKAAKERYEMSALMIVDQEHENHFKKLFDALSKELHDALKTHGYSTRDELALALNSLREEKKKPTLKMIKGGKE